MRIRSQRVCTLNLFQRRCFDKFLQVRYVLFFKLLFCRKLYVNSFWLYFLGGILAICVVFHTDVIIKLNARSTLIYNCTFNDIRQVNNLKGSIWQFGLLQIVFKSRFLSLLFFIMRIHIYVILRVYQRRGLWLSKFFSNINLGFNLRDWSFILWLWNRRNNWLFWFLLILGRICFPGIRTFLNTVIIASEKP